MHCNLSTNILVFIKLKFLRILNFSHSLQEQVMTCSSCTYTIWERKKKLDTAAPEFISLFIFAWPISFGSWQVTRWSEHLYLVRSGGDKNYVLYDVLINLLRGARTFVYQNFFRKSHRYFGFLYWCSFYRKKIAHILITSSLSS